MVRIIIGGDLVPTNVNMHCFEGGNVEKIVGQELLKKLTSADIRIFNLETVLIDEGTPIAKSGPCLKASRQSIKGIAALKPSLLGMANNHIMDYGVEGYKQTVQLLDKYGILHVGAADNLEEATRPIILEKNGIKIGVYACVEHEFTIASEKRAGCNPYDPLECFDHVKQLKAICDFVVVLYHGGKEFYQYGSPELQRLCRKFVQKGADIVVCQHSHCIGAEEKYGDGLIVYGQGNAIFLNDQNEIFNSGLLLDVNIDKCEDVKFSVSYIPVNRRGSMVEVDKNEKLVLQQFMERSKKMKDQQFVMTNYRNFAYSLGAQYSRWGAGNLTKNIFMRVINKFVSKKIFKNIYTQQQALDMINAIRCESHREVFLAYLENNVDL